MRDPTLIPEAYSYGLGILVVLGLSGFSLASHVHARWLAVRGGHFVVVYMGVMAFTVAWGFLLFELNPLFGTRLVMAVLAVVLGLVLGRLAGWSDRLILRYYARHHLVRGTEPGIDRRGRRPQVRGVADLHVRPHTVPVTAAPARKRTIGLARVQHRFAPQLYDERFGIWPLIVIAILEELIYRGFLVEASLLLSSDLLVGLALTGTVLFFAFTHIWFGWPHVVAKLPLGVLALLAVLITGSVVAAMVAHVVFNLDVWRDQHSKPIFATSS